MKSTLFMRFSLYFFIFIALTGSLSCTRPVSDLSVKDVMDKTITRLYKTMDAKELRNLDNDKVMALFSEDEKEVLSTRHWMFTVNVPAVVSVMRSNDQQITPFWLAKSGFVKTDKTIKNEQVTYEVWQKAFKAGHVGLGVNGFENYMLHYFVSVAPQNKNDKLILSDFSPVNQHVGVLDNSAFIYHDWDELVIKDVPDAMKGEKLLTTIRGRGEESHLIGAFRSTAFPSSSKPDQLMLTWSSDPSTGIDVQWRTDTTISDGEVKYREKGSSFEYSVKASRYRMEDRVLMNDRYINRFTAELRDLKPGTTYEYQIVTNPEWLQANSFATSAPDNKFSFNWFGDTHHSSKYGEILRLSEMDYPDAAFFSIAGDMVSDGLQRDQWDDLFEYSKPALSRKPMMSVLGNHDNRSGLGALMYRELFSYPKNGPAGVEKEHTYSFKYKNALLLMIDATAPIDTQSVWIEKELAGTDAEWKFAMFHFPPYNWEEPYFNIQKAWVPIFDKYHVDMVMSGHIHYYMRSKPMKNGKVVDSCNDGTTYLISIGIPANAREMSPEPYAAVRNNEGPLFQNVKIEGKKLTFVSVNADNKVVDSFSIKK